MAQSSLPPEAPRLQRGGTMIEPPAKVDPAYLPLGPDNYPRTSDNAVLTLRLTADFPLRRHTVGGTGTGTQGARPASPTLQAHLRWTPLADKHWFAQGGFVRYLRQEQQQPWHPDFTYGFGYENLAPGSWSLVYANYTGTRLRPDATRGEHRWNFPQGQWTLSHRFVLAGVAERLLLVGDGDQALCTASAHLMPRYGMAADGAEGRHKRSVSFGCRYTRPEGWQAHLTLYAYPDSAQQQPWDPDFTYGFGHAGWWPGFSVHYDNWSGNRFSGRLRGAGEGTFRSGSVSLHWQHTW